jgi:hypothetical protein
MINIPKVSLLVIRSTTSGMCMSYTFWRFMQALGDILDFQFLRCHADTTVTCIVILYLDS